MFLLYFHANYIIMIQCLLLLLLLSNGDAELDGDLTDSNRLMKLNAIDLVFDKCSPPAVGTSSRKV